MPNKKYISGRAAEYEAVKILEKDGYHAQRCAGSHKIDVVAFLKQGNLNKCEFHLIRAISIKFSKKKPNLRKEFAEIRKWQLPRIVSTELWWKVPRKGWVYYEVQSG